MRARLDEIDWTSLACADGNAADLPRLLPAIAAADRADALAALDEVRARIWRDGEVFAATAQAVPFLIELTLAPAVVVRPPILQLLAFLYIAEARSDDRAAVDAARTAV